MSRLRTITLSLAATVGLAGTALVSAPAAPAASTQASTPTSVQSTQKLSTQKYSTQKYKENWSLAGGFFANPFAALNPNASPEGSNVRSCPPTAERPRPVILVHAMGVNQRLNWGATAPYLANRGFCVFSFTYGNHAWLPPAGGLKPMAGSADQLATVVKQVKAKTGASQVDLVGHSEGTTISAYYLKKLGGSSNVRNLVGFAPNYEGTTLYGLTKLADSLPRPLRAVLDSVCGACRDYYPESDFVKNLGEGGRTWVPEVTYTNIQPTLEEVVLPNSSGQMTAPNATNHRTSTGCAKDLSDHVSIATSKRAHQILFNALAPQEAAPLPCAVNPPFLS